MTKPLFITFEGGEGSGKSTQSRMLHQYLLAQGQKAIWTREIGGTKEAEKIRELIMNEDLLDMSTLLLIIAARFEHMNKVIKPALASGAFVICDRFVDSSLCYQGDAIGMDKIVQLHSVIFDSFMPDLTFFIDIDPSIGLSRAMARGDANKFEEKALEFHNKVHHNFKNLAALYPERIITIDGTQEVGKVHEEIVGFILARK
jgi:dTMP kinase